MSKGREGGTFGLRWKDDDPSQIVNNDKIWRNAIQMESAIRNAWGSNFDFLVDDKTKQLEKMANEMTHEKLQKQNYKGTNTLSDATLRQTMMNSNEFLPKPPHLMNRIDPPKKKSKMEDYYCYTIAPTKINPNKLHVDRRQNEAKLEEIERRKYSLTPHATLTRSDLYNKKDSAKRPNSVADTKKAPQKDHEFEKAFRTIIAKKNEGKPLEDKVQCSNGDYGARPTLEVFNTHYTRFGRKKLIFD